MSYKTGAELNLTAFLKTKFYGAVTRVAKMPTQKFILPALRLVSYAAIKKRRSNLAKNARLAKPNLTELRFVATQRKTICSACLLLAVAIAKTLLLQSTSARIPCAFALFEKAVCFASYELLFADKTR